MRFDLLTTDPASAGRAGVVHTAHGAIETPVFMPVGTQGTVKAVEQRELAGLGFGIILGNAYHLYLRPGTPVLEHFGGLHAFMHWDRAILTDSGGYQIFSLRTLRKLNDEGVIFQSHIDGSTHTLTPERVVDIQRAIGSDIMMVLDECPQNPCTRQAAESAVRRTIAWAQRSRLAFAQGSERYGFPQAQFGIVQGSTYADLRQHCSQALQEIGFEGYAIGGLAVGEPNDVMYEVAASTAATLPVDRPRYLMGVGSPWNILECIARGIDMFDCVMPTRNARNGQLFTADGTINMRNARFARDEKPPDEGCDCYTCANFTRGYLRHLFIAGEILALQLATLHNLAFYKRVVAEARTRILDGTFGGWYRGAAERMSGGNGYEKVPPIG